ncbi:Long-chain-alcohol dehydrogenase 1 [termite gut metagenome]|uniref:Long-chain-alcohol dehydrogenase 1 n=1 Tax=termite gut metagenome TaxID=433724 RepID=A0A5J4SFB7_9ZZZZ
MEKETYVGDFSIDSLFTTLQNSSFKEIFLVRGKRSYELCGAKLVIENIKSLFNYTITEFFDFQENPKIEDLEKGLRFMSNIKADLIIGIGGGSVLDMSKLIRFFYSYSGDITNTQFEKQKGLIPLITIPTTAGTGSEVTHFAVLYKEKIKYSIEHNDVLPDMAIVHPSFTYNNSPYLTACTGFDALAHAIEAYWNINATEESDTYAVKAIKLLYPNLSVVVNAPAKEARIKVSEGAYWAGKAINITKTTAPHAVSYPFTTYYNYPHGHAVALTFPYFAEYNIKKVSELSTKLSRDRYVDKMKYLCSIIGTTIESDIRLLFHNYIKKIGLSFNLLHDFQVELIIKNINTQRMVNNPMRFTLEQLRRYINNTNTEYEGN